MRKRSTQSNRRVPEWKAGPLKELQERIFRNKKKKGFNTSSNFYGINQEICHLVEELGELASAHRRGKRVNVVDGVIDMVVFSLGLLEIFGVDADKEMQKVLKNIEKRKYVVRKDGTVRRIK